MISHSIIKEKPTLRLISTGPVAYKSPRWPGSNQSSITNNAMLEEFLKTTPLEGTWCWRVRYPGYDQAQHLTGVSQCQYVIRILRALEHTEMRYGHTGGFPETHELINTMPYSTGDYYRRFVDIRDYEPLTNEELEKYISAELQNHIQTLIAPGTKQA
jgi:hypothetical protein